MSLKRLVTNKAIYNWACNLPVDLMAAYDQLWKNIKEHDKYDAALAERAIMLVLYSFEPLETEFLLHAIRYVPQGSTFVRNEEQTQQQILSLCQDLLTVDEERDVWMLPHASVAEYFEKRGWMSLWECDAFASKLCLNFLGGHLDDHLDDDPLTSYVGQYWHKHVERYDKWLGSREQEVEQEPDPDLAAALKRFLGSPDKSSANFQRWAESAGWESHEPPFLFMCRYGFYYTLRGWWDRPGKITVRVALGGIFGFDALYVAAQGHCMPICRYLAKLIDAVHPEADNYYMRELTISARSNNFGMVKFLVTEKKADVNSARREAWDNNYSVAQYVAKENPQMLQWLVDQGVVDLERENDSGCKDGNVLIAAASLPNLESARILLKAGANADAVVQNGDYGSALVAAVGYRHTCGYDTEMVQPLLDHGADPKRPMRGGQWGSAFEASLVRGWASEFREDRKNIHFLLLEAGADPAAVSEYGEYGSTMAAAAFWGREEDLRAMIGKVGTERAIEALGQSRHPDERRFNGQRDIARWKETATYLAEEVGVSKEILYTIGFWDVEPEPEPSAWEDMFVLRYNKHH